MENSTCFKLNCFLQIRTLCLCLGFNITFGAMFAKTWRVYRLFTQKKLVRMVST